MTLTEQDRLEARDWVCRALSPVWSDEPLSPPRSHLWPEIVRLADAWLIGPRLHDRCRDSGFLPPDAESVLSAVSDYATLRTNAMRAELEAVIQALNAAGVVPVLFKGAEWVLDHYAPYARRLISDLDLWVPEPAGQQQAMHTLQDMGYRPYLPLEQFDPSTSHHFPPFHKEGAVARIELHHNLIRPSLSGSMELKAAAARLEETKRKGLRYRRLAHMDGITVAFLQSGWMASPGFETRKVAVSKWLDFLDRYGAGGWMPVKEPAALGIIDGHNTVDTQLLTALQMKFGFPYQGPKDDRYVTEWATAKPLGPQLYQNLWQSMTIRNLTSLSAWRRFIMGFNDRIRRVRFLNRL